MENKINIAELLKDYPGGMELDCALYDDVTLSEVSDNRDDKFPIKIAIGANRYRYLTKTGGFDIIPESKCVIYPKGKTTWEGFVPPCGFKDGNILATDLGSVFYLNTRLNTDEYYGCYVGIGGDGSFHICEPFAYKECCGFATEEEKEKLFKAIKANGYKWNEETKTLEKLIEPSFKVGDKVRHKNNHGVVFTITSIEEDSYVCGAKAAFWFDDQDDYELVPDKFDITTLKPFDKVLARDTDNSMWIATLFSHLRGMTFYTVSSWYNQCIPFEGNEHLIGTTYDCDTFYKTWK